VGRDVRAGFGLFDALDGYVMELAWISVVALGAVCAFVAAFI